jgi:PAS domain S-box-containing protein
MAAHPDTEAERRFHSLADDLDVIVWESTPSRRVTYVSKRAEQILGHPISAWLADGDFWSRTMHPADRDRVQRDLEDAVGRSDRVVLEYRSIAADRSAVWLHDVVHVIRDEAGTAVELRGMAFDITSTKIAERRQAAQHAAVRVMAEADDISEAAPHLLQSMCETLEWEVGALWKLYPGANTLRLVDMWHVPGRSLEHFGERSRATRFASGIGLPGRVWLTRKPAWIPNVAEDPNFPRAPTAAKAGLRGACGFPVIGADDEFIGVMEFFSSEVREPNPELLEFMSSIGSQIGQFVQRTRWERLVRRSQEQTALLAEAGVILARSLDLSTTLANLVRLVTPRLADWCAVDVVGEDGELRRLASSHVDAVASGASDEGDRPSHDAVRGPARVTQSAEAELYAEVDEQLLFEMAQGQRNTTALRKIGVRSAMIVPLVARGRTLGAVTLAAGESGRIYDESDLALAKDLANRAGLAIDNARLYSDRSSVAQVLQQSLLPPVLPAISRVEIAARYRPAGEGNEVGGDFYDVFATGRDDWAIVMGDVCGKGAEAAAMTALARYTLRAAAMQARKPSRVLSTLNEALLRQREDRRFCTVVYARLRTVEGRKRVTIACGGHPQPLILRANGTVEAAGIPGTMLGFFTDPTLIDAAVDLGPADALILYTDGVTEARNDGEFFGEERLEELIAACGGCEAAVIADRIERAVFDFQTGKARDDTAILVLRALP